MDSSGRICWVPVFHVFFAEPCVTDKEAGRNGKILQLAHNSASDSTAQSCRTLVGFGLLSRV